MKHVLASAFCTLVLASALALPASADKLPVGVTPTGPTENAPADPPQIIIFPHCPAGFAQVHSDAHLFLCNKVVSPTGAEAAAQAARNATCGRASWIGPEVFASAVDGHLAVNFRCRR